MKVVIIGGGLVGSLSAIFFGKKGHEVYLYECRPDPRKTSKTAGRSINLALSMRGRTALRALGLEKAILEHGIPMYGRMIHDADGNTSPIIYDPVYKNCIYSVGRKHLNDLLLNEASELPNVHLHFESKLQKIVPDSGLAVMKMSDEEAIEVSGDLIVGADGAYSAVRRDLMKACPMNFSQTYIDHGYIELRVPPHNNHMMTPNHLHIWPRGEFMMIALPNQDRSWTVTLFMPLFIFKALQDTSGILAFFHTHFPDAIPLIGKDELVTTFASNKPSHLISIKCSKYHFGSKLVIIGDAAHAMVPFYGQGMNAGFEDCTILDDLLHNHKYSTGEALEEFSIRRNPDAEAVCDLAMYNYTEMRDLVNKRSFRLRKALDDLLYRIFQAKWVPLYQSVTFTNISYRKCLENKKKQDKLVRKMLWSSFAVIFMLIVLWPVLYYGRTPYIAEGQCSAGYS